jgi:hypothetical protein
MIGGRSCCAFMGNLLKPVVLLRANALLQGDWQP